MLSILKDMNLLYSQSEEIFNDWSNSEMVKTVVPFYKEYGERILADVKPHVHDMIAYSYKGCIDRIAREVYQVTINKNKYDVFFVFDRRDENKVQLHIEIGSIDIKTQDYEEKYDKDLETLKLALKDRLIKDWENCTCLIDEQSELLCADLYHRIFKIENQFRAFANKVLIQHMGCKWLELPGLEKYRESVSNLEITFKKIVKEFANIDSTLISMTLETLSEIILKASIFNEDENTVLTFSDVVKLYQHLNGYKNDAAKQLIQSKQRIKLKIWDDIFKQYFAESEQFQVQLTQFIKCRNHVAHNKLLTIAVFNQMHNELDAFETTVLKATDLFESKNASDELLETMRYEDEKSANWDDHIRYLMVSATGVKIRSASEIYEMFCETVMKLYEDLTDRYHYDPCFDVSDVEHLAENGSSVLCTITCNASGDILEIFVSTSIDEDMNSTSFLKIKAEHKGKTVTEVECTYQNGEVHEDDIGVFCRIATPNMTILGCPIFLRTWSIISMMV